MNFKPLNFIKRAWNNKHIRELGPPFLYSLGPIIGSIAFEWNPAQEFIKNNIYKDFDKWIQQHTGFALFLIIFWVPLLYILGRIAGKFLNESINIDWLIATLETLDLPVKSKKSRFGQFIVNFLNNNPNGSRKDIFREITKPKKQFERLISGLYQIFKSICNDDVRIVIFIYQNQDNPSLSYFISWPEENPLSDPKELLTDNSCVISCIKRKELVIVEDIDKELKKPQNKRRFVITSSKRNKGSILCFPIDDSFLRQINTILVISIYCRRPFSFYNSKRDGYKEILRRFADRILIEYYLWLIRRHRYGE
jgi:hypothetical protein